MSKYIAFSPTGKTRTKEKYRVVYTDHQRLELEKEFHCNRYITIRRKSELAVNLGLSERQVHWKYNQHILNVISIGWGLGEVCKQEWKQNRRPRHFPSSFKAHILPTGSLVSLVSGFINNWMCRAICRWRSKGLGHRRWRIT